MELYEIAWYEFFHIIKLYDKHFWLNRVHMKKHLGYVKIFGELLRELRKILEIVPD